MLRPLRCAPALLLVLLACAPAASAATTTTLPADPAARTFPTSAGGWTATSSVDGLLCVPGLTCPVPTAQWQAGAGTGPDPDGALRARFTGVASLLSRSSITWTSPAVTVPAGFDSARLEASIHPTGSALLALRSLRFDMRLVDTAAPATPVVVRSGVSFDAATGYVRVGGQVPAGQLTAGHSYRIQLVTRLGDVLSALSTATIDMDDVALALTTLEPPSGLTASVPGTGALRVTGSVDPNGQDTSVVVRYGESTGYGTTTSPVTVSGDGAQSFSTPLVGLVPGRTYHYQVVATNLDGTVTTQDATFVAPTPPTDAPPSVAGAQSSRERIATYDRAAGVTDATIEVLDGAGGVVGTFPDTDADGSVAITLPNADGDYGVRVVRVDARGATTTSAPTPVTLDREPPDTTGMTVAVTPVIASDRRRTVTFDPPADAVRATAQVVDADGAPVGPAVDATGGTATVTVGAQDGTYRVLVTVVDAAGNAADPVSSAALTLDSSAPDAGGAPVVTGPGNSRDRTVTFDRDPTTTTATIEVLDAGGNRVGGLTPATGTSAAITLPDADGAYSVRVHQTDAAGNEAITAPTTVTLDRVAPAAGGPPTVTGDDDGRARTVTFDRDPDTATATVEIVDADGDVVGRVPVDAGSNSADVTLPNTDGEYTIRVRQEDAAGNAATSPGTPVTLDRAAPNPGDAPTVTGDDNTRARTVTFDRASDAATVTVEILDDDENVVGREDVPSGGLAAITLPDADGDYTVRVRQTDAAGNSDVSPGTAVTLDRTPPGAGEAPDVAGAGNDRDRTVTFTRDPDADTVTVEIVDDGGTVVDRVDVPAGGTATITLPDADGDYDVQVRQTDAAGNDAVSPATPVTLDRVAPDSGGAPTVTGADTSRTRDVTFDRAADAAQVVVEVLDDAGTVVATQDVPAGGSATITLPNAAGDYDVRVRQIDAAGNQATSPATGVTFTPGASGGGSGGGTPTPPGTGTPVTPPVGGTGAAGSGGATQPGAGGSTGTPGGSTPSAAAAAYAAMLSSCFGGPLAIVDARVVGRRVRITGVSTQPKGTKVRIVDVRGRRVGTATTDTKGNFTVRVRRPAARSVAKTRYRAVLGRARSRLVRLGRLNALTKVTRSGGRIVVTGRITAKARTGRLRFTATGGFGATACTSGAKRLPIVGRVRLDRRTGTYRMTLRATGSASSRVAVRVRVSGAVNSTTAYAIG